MKYKYKQYNNYIVYLPNEIINLIFSFIERHMPSIIPVGHGKFTIKTT